MLFCDIRPFLRFSRFYTPPKKSRPVLAYDCRLFYLISGEALVSVDGESYACKENDLVFLRAGVPYRITSEKEGTSFLAMNFDFSYENRTKKNPIPPDSENDFAENHILEKISFSDTAALDRVLFLPESASLLPHLLAAHEEFSEKRLYADGRASSHLYLFFSEIARRIPARGRVKIPTAGEEILTYLREHFRENITNDELSRRFHYHPNYIGELVKAKTGVSVHRYILNLRLAEAISLLETTSLSVTAVAESVGFSDINYFSNYFKKSTGCSPKEFRKK